MANSNRDSPRQQESEVAGHIQPTGKKQKMTNICAHLTQNIPVSGPLSSPLTWGMLGAPGGWEDIARHKVRAQRTIYYMGFQRDFELQVPEESPSQHELQTMDLLCLVDNHGHKCTCVHTHHQCYLPKTKYYLSKSWSPFQCQGICRFAHSSSTFAALIQ